jgi:hypothetical protein
MRKSNLANIALLGALATSICGPANAGGSLSLGYVADSQLELDSDFGSDEVDGDGFSLQGSFDITDNLFAYGDYYTRTLEDAFGEFDWNTMRIGIGFSFDNVPIYIGVNWEDVEIEIEGDSDSEDGFGIRAGGRLPLGERFALLGELGYTVLDEASSADAAIGVSVTLNETASIFADYRATVYEPDDNPDDVTLTLNDLRLGVRFDF